MYGLSGVSMVGPHNVTLHLYVRCPQTPPLDCPYIHPLLLYGYGLTDNKKKKNMTKKVPVLGIHVYKYCARAYPMSSSRCLVPLVEVWVVKVQVRSCTGYAIQRPRIASRPSCIVLVLL